MPSAFVANYIHLVFSTKGRKPHIDLEIEPKLHAYINSICIANKSPVIQIGGHFDHIHVLNRLSPLICLSDLVSKVKSCSSKWMKSQGPFYRSFSWQRGYAAFSVAQDDLGSVAAYIGRQHEHHRGIPFAEELEGFLKDYEIEYEERYLFSD